MTVLFFNSSVVVLTDEAEKVYQYSKELIREIDRQKALNDFRLKAFFNIDKINGGKNYG